MTQATAERSRDADALERRFAATAEQAEHFIAAMHGFLAERGLAGLAFDMELAAREALANALQHGCSGDATRIIQAGIRRGAEGLELTVDDTGAGWDWRSWSAPQEEPPAGPGRGLFLITKYSDGFCFNDAGNCIRILRRLPKCAAGGEPVPDAQAPARFGPLELRFSGARGVIRLPARVDRDVLVALRAALLEAGERCAEVLVDLSALTHADLFLAQLLLSAARSYAGRGKRLLTAGSVPEAWRQTCASQGFGLPEYFGSILPEI